MKRSLFNRYAGFNRYTGSILLAATMLLGATAPATADNSATEDGLSLEKIMRNPDWIGNQPTAFYWDDDGSTVYYQRKRNDEKFNDWYAINADGSNDRMLDAEEIADVPAHGGQVSRDGKRRVVARNGDVFLHELELGITRQLTRTSATESGPFFMADDRRIAWSTNGSHMIYDPATGLIEEAVAVKAEDDPQVEKEDFNYLEDQQLRLFSTLRREQRRDDNEEARDRALHEADATRIAPTLYLGADRNILFSSLSPGGQYVLVVSQAKKHENGKSDSMPNFVTESGYVENRDVRTLVGLNDPAPHTLHLIDLQANKATTLALDELPDIESDPLKSIRNDAIDYHIEQGNDKQLVEKALKAPEVRPARIEGIEWTRDGSKVAVQVHSVDNKDRWIATVDFDDAELESQHQLAINNGWINWYFNEYGWLPDNETLWYLSEESGFSQLYVKKPGRRATRLTNGEFVVSDPEVTHDGNHFYYVANPERSGTFNVFRVASNGNSQPERISRISVQPSTRAAGGDHAPFMLSPDETRILFKHDNPTSPAEIHVQAIEGNASPLKLTDSTSEEFSAIDWVAPEIVEVPSTNFNGSITSRVYTPRNFDPSKKYPAVVFVHGAGYLHNAHDGWSVYFREFMFHNILLRKGYVVIDMDYRGSAGYGRDWRTAIYRQMGHPELEDLLDGKRWLVENRSVDPDRVGIYGGSYGGFMAFMALFRSPGEWAAGAALRPVTDWVHYNHPYTSNILNTPLVDPMAYEKSSPIEWAEDYDNTPMLIAHGMQDDNVFFKDSVRLVQRLIELKKENFEIAPYPLDPHGFVHPESWLDEYRRIFKLFEEELK